MALKEKDIIQLISAAIPDAQVEIKDLMGDNNHYSAIVKSKYLREQKLINTNLFITKGKMGNELHALSISTEVL